MNRTICDFFRHGSLLSSARPETSILLSQRRKDAKKTFSMALYINHLSLCDLCALARDILSGRALSSDYSAPGAWVLASNWRNDSASMGRL